MFFITFFEIIGEKIVGILTQTGEFAVFSLKSFKFLFKKPFRFKSLINSLDSIAFNSIPIIALSSLTVGMIMSLQITVIMRMFSAEGFVGATVAMTLGRELSPVMTALMLIAKNGSSMAAEFGSMKVSEQLDALETMSVEPIHYFVVPRLIASFLAFPILTALANIIGILGAYFVAVTLQHVDPALFWDKLYFFVDPPDIYSGLIKAAVMGIIVTLICSFFGYATKNGAKGVGQATTKAVVFSSVAILVADYIMSEIMIKLLF